MITINLNNLQFFGYHGIHEEEKILGNTFEVNIAINVKETDKIESIHQTINYVDIYEIIKTEMKKPTALLETLLQNIVAQIKNVEKKITSITINIKKNNPPIKNFIGSVSVSYQKNF